VTDQLNNPIEGPADTPESDVPEADAPKVDVETPATTEGSHAPAGSGESEAPSTTEAPPQTEPSPQSEESASQESSAERETPVVAAEPIDSSEAPATPPAAANGQTESAVEVKPSAASAESVGGDEPAAAEDPVQQSAPSEPADKSDNMNWYILKVQSNREDSIRDGLMRRVAIAGLDYFFGQVIVPTEQVAEFKGGKKRVTTRKLYPGYLVVEMEINDDTWFLVRETPGIGDFTGAAGRPTPMLPHEVDRILARQEEKTDEAPKPRIGFHSGDRVKINEGTFENFEGEVHSIDEANGRVTVMINIFGRSTPVELEYWQIESI
jgi:transcriptional antiterminator NusG